MTTQAALIPWWWYVVFGVIPYLALAAGSWGLLALVRRRGVAGPRAFIATGASIAAVGLAIGAFTWRSGAFDGQGEEISWVLGIAGLAILTPGAASAGLAKLRGRRA